MILFFATFCSGIEFKQPGSRGWNGDGQSAVCTSFTGSSRRYVDLFMGRSECFCGSDSLVAQDAYVCLSDDIVQQRTIQLAAHDGKP